MRLIGAILRCFRGAGATPAPDPLVAARLEREHQDVMAHQAATVVAVECLAFCGVHPPNHWNCRKACVKPLGHQRPDGGNNAHACASVIYGW